MLSFIGFAVPQEPLLRMEFLYNLRFSYFDFGNALHLAIPADYFEESQGNFAFFEADSNFLRVAGTTLLVAGIVAFFSCLFRLLDRLLNIRKYKPLRTTRKSVYRAIEFFYKLCIQPLLFFSFVTYSNWHPRSMVSYPQFLNVCHVLTVLIPVLYLLVTAFQIWGENISRLNRVEDAMEFFSAATVAWVISQSLHKKLYAAVVIILLFRGAVYIMLRRIILRDFKTIEYTKVFTTVLECITVCLTLSKSTAAIACSAVITVSIQLMHSMYLTHMALRNAKI